MTKSALHWLRVVRGDAPLILSLPHTGTDLCDLEDRLVSPWRARKDADWWIEKLYDFALQLGATMVRTTLSRTVIDVNRDPSGQSLYPGQATTELCPTTTFDGEPLYLPGALPSAEEVSERRVTYHAPYHHALGVEIARLRSIHPQIVVYDCHSIRSEIGRLFDGTLPNFNIGTNSGQSSNRSLAEKIEEICAGSDLTYVLNGRFKGGYITRSLGKPEQGVHAIQMELACRGYMKEPDIVDENTWPSEYDAEYAAPLRATLTRILEACLTFTSGKV